MTVVKVSLPGKSEAPHDLEQVISITDAAVLSCSPQQDQLRRDIGPWQIVALGFNICNSWIAMSTALAIAISAGGSVTVLYGLILVSFAYLAIALTLAELASVYPTAGGQYHFVSVLCSENFNRPLSYVCGLAAVCSWVFLAAAITILAAQLILAVPAYYVENYVPEGWHYFLVFQLINAMLCGYNIFALKRAPWTHNIGFVLSLVSFLVILVTCLALSTKTLSTVVWTTFDNATGWPSGITFLTGLVTPAAMYGGIDACLHLAEECKQPERTVPKAVMCVVAIGFATGFGFSIAMCYGITDIEPLIGATMPIYELWRQATGSATAATVFVVVLAVIIFFTVNAVQQTASRMTWAFARDGALPARVWLAAVHPTLEVPVWSLVANAFIIFLCGCIYLGSTAAFTAVIGSSLILQVLSFTMPAMLLLWRKRSASVLPTNRPFRLPGVVGWTANLLVIIFGIVFTVFFSFPAAIPVSGSSMNYASAVIAVVGLLGTLNWFICARNQYAGLRLA